MLISQYKSRTGKEKVIANDEKGRREKDTHLDSIFYVPGRPTVSAKNRPRRFSPSPPRRGLTWFYKEPSPPQRSTWFVYRP